MLGHEKARAALDADKSELVNEDAPALVDLQAAGAGAVLGALAHDAAELGKRRRARAARALREEV